MKEAAHNQEGEFAGEEPADSWISVRARARKLGVQLPTTPELVRTCGKREFGEDGEQVGWTCYYHTHESETHRLARKKLATYRKACEQKVRRAEVRLNANHIEASRQYDREQKRASYAKKREARVAQHLKDARATAI